MKNSEIIEFDYEPLQGQRLRQAQGDVPLVYQDGCVGYDNVRLVLDSCEILVSVDADTDEIFISLERDTVVNEPETWIDIGALQIHIGSEIGWLWRARNWMGYSDMLVLSFSGIEPSIAIVGSASKLSLYQIERLCA